jgi:hypothetical protein
MSLEKLLEEIKFKGYWKIEIRPTKFDKNRITTLGNVQQLVSSNLVALRGWDYPHWNQEKIRNVDDYVECQEDWDRHLEYWRFYQSGKFIHLVALYEDHLDLSSAMPIQYPPRTPRSGYVSFVSTIYHITEIFEFAARLANKGILQPSGFISIGLYNIKDHELTTFGSRRYLPEGYVYANDKPLLIEREISQQELINKPDEHALDFITSIFERFQWNQPPRQIFSEDQKRLRERRL